MDFDESVRAMEALSGKAVEAEIWGVGSGSDVAYLSGELRHMPHFAPEELPAALVEATGEKAEIFVVGDAHLNLWPSRFISGQRMSNTRGWLELRTKDAVLRIGPKSRPWID